MSAQEKWVKWQLSGMNLLPKYYINFIGDSGKGLEIELLENFQNKKKLSVKFRHGVDNYRVTDKKYRTKTIDIINAMYGADFLQSWMFFKVENSLYQEWFAEESYEVWKEEPYKHFAFITDEIILDIVVGYEPKVEVIYGK